MYFQLSETVRESKDDDFECLPLRKLFRALALLHEGQRKDTVLQIPNITALRVDSPTTDCQVGFLLCFML